MTSYRSEKGIRIVAIAVAVFSVFLVVLLVPKRSALTPAAPPATLSFAGLSNLPPFGTMTAFRFSNSSPTTLMFGPKVVRYRDQERMVGVPVSGIVQCNGELPPGGSYVVYIPAIVTNGSLEVVLECRGKGSPGSFPDTLDRWIKMADGTMGVWLGDHYSGVITEAGRSRSPGRPAEGGSDSVR